MNEAPQSPEQAAPSPKKNPKDLVVNINSELMQLADMLGQNKATQGEAQAMGEVVSQYQKIIESLGQAPGAQPPQPPGPQGAVPMEAGANPNARPM